MYILYVHSERIKKYSNFKRLIYERICCLIIIWWGNIVRPNDFHKLCTIIWIMTENDMVLSISKSNLCIIVGVYCVYVDNSITKKKKREKKTSNNVLIHKMQLMDANRKIICLTATLIKSLSLASIEYSWWGCQWQTNKTNYQLFYPKINT